MFMVPKTKRKSSRCRASGETVVGDALLVLLNFSRAVAFPHP